MAAPAADYISHSGATGTPSSPPNFNLYLLLTGLIITAVGLFNPFAPPRAVERGAAKKARRLERVMGSIGGERPRRGPQSVRLKAQYWWQRVRIGAQLHGPNLTFGPGAAATIWATGVVTGIFCSATTPGVTAVMTAMLLAIGAGAFVWLRALAARGELLGRKKGAGARESVHSPGSCARRR